MKKTTIEKLGLKAHPKLNAKICRERLKKLRAGLDKGKYKGELKKSAQYYASLFKWLAKNGGSHYGRRKAA